jgi:hypothetical protein
MLKSQRGDTGTCRRWEMFYYFGKGEVKERGQLEELGIHGRIILKSVLIL